MDFGRKPELLKANLTVIFGDAFLVNQTLKNLLNALKLNAADLDTFYGNDDGEVGQALAQAQTFPLLGDGRVVLLKDADFLQNAADRGTLLENARKAWEDNDTKAACKSLLSFLSAADLTLDDAAPHNKAAINETLAKEAFFDEVVTQCVNDGLKPRKTEQGADMLFATLEKGLPKANKLVITACSLDKRRKVFKMLEEKALLIDCSVPKSDYKADKDVQSQIVRQQAEVFTKRTGKQLASGVLVLLPELIGFDLYAITAAFEQLADYVGTRSKITEADVNTLFSRTKTDPIYELTSAVAQVNLAQSLFYLDSLLRNAKMFPLQVLAAIANQIRKLAVARGFLTSPYGRSFNASMTYQSFQRETLSQITRYDEELKAALGTWENQLLPPENNADVTGKLKSKKAKKAVSINDDFLVAKDGKSTYPVYLLLQNAGRYPTDKWPVIFKLLLDTESALKLSPANPRLLLEKMLLDIFNLCAKRAS